MRVGGHGLLEQAVEQQARSSSCATVEPEGELVEVAVEVLDADAVVQGPGHPTFEQRGNQVDAGQLDVGRVIDAERLTGLCR